MAFEKHFPYEKLTLDLSGARNGTEPTAIHGRLLIVRSITTDATLTVKIDKESADEIVLNEDEGFRRIRYPIGFDKLYFTNSAQADKSAELWILRDRLDFKKKLRITKLSELKELIANQELDMNSEAIVMVGEITPFEDTVILGDSGLRFEAFLSRIRECNTIDVDQIGQGPGAASVTFTDGLKTDNIYEETAGAGVTINSSMYPGVTGTLALGTALLRFIHVYGILGNFTRLNLGVAAGQGVASHLLMYDTMGILTAYDNTAHVPFKAYDGAAFQECARLSGGAGTPEFGISRSGDITLLSAKLLNTINGILRLPDSRPASPIANDVRYDAPTDTLEAYDGAAWHSHGSKEKSGIVTTDENGVYDVVFGSPYAGGNYLVLLSVKNPGEGNVAFAFWSIRTINGFRIKTKKADGSDAPNETVSWKASNAINS